MRRIRLRGSAIAMAVSTAIVLSATGVSGAATSEPAPGVTPDAVKIGFITSTSGPAASTSGHSDAGCKARVGRANAAGGVHGRKVDVVYADDQTSCEPAGGAEPGPERPRLPGHQRLGDRVPELPLAPRPRRAADRRWVRRELLRRTRQREGDLGVRQLAPGGGAADDTHDEDHEVARRDEGGCPGLRLVAVVGDEREELHAVRGAGGRSRSRVHEHVDRVRYGRRRARSRSGSRTRMRTVRTTRWTSPRTSRWRRRCSRTASR